MFSDSHIHTGKRQLQKIKRSAATKTSEECGESEQGDFRKVKHKANSARGLLERVLLP